MDRFDDMRVFQTIARTASITATAAEFDVAPSAVSRRLKALEERLGVQLVHRTTRTLTLTPAGETYLAGTNDILDSVEHLEGGLQIGAGTLTGRIRLSAPFSFALTALPDVLKGFVDENPGVELDLQLTDSRVDLVGEGFDLALRIGELSDSSLIAKRLCPVTMAVAGPPSLIEQHGPFEKPADFAGAPSVVYTNVPNSHIWTFGDGETVATRPVFRVNNGEMLREMSVRGLGFVREPRFILAPAIEAGQLIEILPDINWGVSRLHAVYPPMAHMPVRLRTFIDYLAGALKC
ncbi:LysR family transcriptional regulator [Parvularcula marina]|uniref:LysR family transcriptional regulator n=1 Tax=Parvularcula marina TaxID=2292771 RepID=UPI00351998F9